MRWSLVVPIVVIGCRSATPELSETRQLSVKLVPNDHDFGTITVGQQTPEASIKVKPTAGWNFDTIVAIEETPACPDFSITAAGLPVDVFRTCIPGVWPCETDEIVTYDFGARFAPSVPGPQSCVVTVTTMDPGSTKTMSLRGTGVAPPRDIEVQPTSLPFGDVRVDTTSTAASVSVRNLGTAQLVVSSVTISAGYAMSGPSSFSVGPGGLQTLSITCGPDAVGPRSGALTIHSDDPVTPMVIVPLDCTGVDSNLEISPSPAVLPDTRVGEPSVQTIVLRNVGTAATTIDGVLVLGSGLSITNGPPPGRVLPAGGAAAVTIRFDAAVRGTSGGTLVVSTTDGERTAQISATALLAAMSVDPDGIADLGPVCVGHRATQRFTILGIGDGSFRVSSISALDPPFTLDGPALPATVPALGTAPVIVDVIADPIGAGIAEQTISITTDIPGSTPRAIDLRVEGLAAGITATPAQDDLGSTGIGDATLATPITVTNCGAGAIDLATARLVGRDAEDFAIVLSPEETSLEPARSATWLVVLAPRTAGLKEAAFELAHPDGTVTVALLGEGLGGLEQEVTDPRTAVGPSSYYTCSAGDRPAAWPLLVAAAIACRKRRRTQMRRRGVVSTTPVT